MTWMTGVELSARYVVGERRLGEFAARGNLPMRRPADGDVLYDESVARRLFKPRDRALAPTVSAPAQASRGSLGTLGVTRLGEAHGSQTHSHAPVSVPPMSGRRVSRRAAHTASLPDLAWTAPVAKIAG